MGRVIAFYGDEKRGAEIIQTLEMLGGRAGVGLLCEDEHRIYYINKTSRFIEHTSPYIFTDEDKSYFSDNYVIMNLDDFKDKYPYRLGDTVRLVHLVGDDFGQIITNVKWSEQLETVQYQVSNIELWWRAKDLQSVSVSDRSGNGANLAILGSNTYSKEIKEIFSNMYGVKNVPNYRYDDEYGYYVLNDFLYVENISVSNLPNNGYHKMTYEEFIEKYPYKVGDKVVADIIGPTTITEYVWLYNKQTIVYRVEGNDSYFDVSSLSPYQEDVQEDVKLEEKQEEISDKISLINSTKSYIEIELGKDYKVEERNGKVFIVRKTYFPKTYDECCNLLGIPSDIKLEVKTESDESLKPFAKRYAESMQCLYKLLICRDAYLLLERDMPREDNNMIYQIKNVNDRVVLYHSQHVQNHILSFYTAKAQKAFFENFDVDIEKCKKYL